MRDKDENLPDFVHRPHDALFQRIMSDPAAVREMIELLPEDLRERVDLNSLRPTDTHFIDDSLRHLYSDCMLEGRLTSGEDVRIYFLVEHQNQPDRTMALRFRDYQDSYWDKELRQSQGKGKLSLIIPVLIYNGKGKYPYSLDLRDLIDAPADLVEKHLYRAPTLIALSDIPDARLAQKVHVGAAFIAMKHAYDEIPAELIFQMLTLLEDDKHRQGLVVSLFSYIITLSSHLDPAGLVEVVAKYLGQEAKEGVMTIAQQLIEQGREEGREQGREQGREEGKALIAKRMLGQGYDLETIRKLVDLPLEELMLLADDFKH